MLLFIISFASGVLTVLAPCILPLLPVIVGHSITDATPNRKRLFVVVTSLGISVILFTLLLKASTLFINIPQEFWKYISGGIIFTFGLTMVFPNIWEKFTLANTLSLKSNKVLGEGYKKNSVWGDVIIGASLGPIFSACSPTYFVILATVLPVSFFLGLTYLMTYVLGLSLALVLVALLGEKVMARVGKISDPNGWFKKIFGIIFILVAIGIVSGYDKKLQISLLNAGFFDVTKIEQRLLDKNNPGNLTPEPEQVNVEEKTEKGEKKLDMETSKIDASSLLSLTEKSKMYPKAPDISTPDGFVNTNNLPITINEFKGKKVVLLDIWTYSCINCQRTIPYLNEWHKKYEDEGLVIIGLHTPEFAFERIQANVEKAVTEFGIKYPVVLDNDFSTWVAYKNQFWPRKYLIDIDGYIVYDHAGEGQYAETETAIQKALKERAIRLDMNIKVSTDISKPADGVVANQSKISSIEAYFGSGRNDFLANGKIGTQGEQTLIIPDKISPNKIYLDGTWSFDHEKAENKGKASIIFNYGAKNVYLVASSLLGMDVEIYVDDVFVKSVNIKDEKLYTMVNGNDYGKHTLKIVIPNSGLEAFAFTFG